MPRVDNGKTEWLCVQCGNKLGEVFGGEYYPSNTVKSMMTSGPNLLVICPECGGKKTWYSSDPIVRAIYQLVDAITSQMARALIHQVGPMLHTKENDKK